MTFATTPALFDHIPSQTGPDDRRTLLALQDYVRQRPGEYTYLEIGSHLGGSIAPHLMDPQCKRIYSVDPRPETQPDARRPGHVAHYPGNSTGAMMARLAEIGDTSKVTTFEAPTRGVFPGNPTHAPDLCFIDAEHTCRAVRSDFEWCSRKSADRAIIILHDIRTLHPALKSIRKMLHPRPFVEFKGGGSTYVFSLDWDILKHSPALRAIRRRAYWPWLKFRAKHLFT